MDIVQNILLLLTGMVVLNLCISVYFWIKNRTLLNLSLVFLWITLLLSFFVQGIFNHNLDYSIVAFGVTVFLNNLSLASLIHILLHEKLNYMKYVVWVGVGFSCFLCTYYLDQSFFLKSVFICLAVSYPLLDSAIISKKHWASMSTTAKILVFFTVLYYVHTLDYALLRDKPDMAILGFSFAYIIIYGLSIFAPSVITEFLYVEKAKMEMSINATHDIQSQVLPKGITIPGYDYVAYIKQAEAVGGDFYDVVNNKDVTWVISGDVTGHSMSSGLVMFMVQSTLLTLIRSHKDISPKQLNYMANGILFENISRLENKLNSSVSVLRLQDTSCIYSGYDTDLFVYRASTQSVEVYPVFNNPYGLAFDDSSGEDDYKESTITLYSGDIILKVSDGIIEAPFQGDYSKGLFESKRVQTLLKENAHMSPELIKSSLLSAVLDYSNQQIDDDITILVLKKV